METRQQGRPCFRRARADRDPRRELWLIAAAVDALMARQTTMLPTAIASTVLLVLSGGLLCASPRSTPAALEPAWLIEPAAQAASRSGTEIRRGLLARFRSRKC
jgi:hypothetical protein